MQHLVFIFLLSVFAAVSSYKRGSQVLSRPDCLRVDRVQSAAAVIHWKPQTSTQRLNHIVLCTGAYYKTPVNASWDPAVDFVTRYVPAEMHQLTLTNLKPNANYSCMVETERVGLGRPCRFSTNKQGAYVAADPDSDRLSSLRAKFNHMAATILLGGVLPMLLVGGCVGTIYLYMRYQSFRQNARHLKQYQRVPTFGPSGGYPGSPGPCSVPPSPYSNRHGLPPSPYNTMPPSVVPAPSPYNSLPPSPFIPMPPSPVPPPTSQYPHKTMTSSPYATMPPSSYTATPIVSPYQTVPQMQPFPQQNTPLPNPPRVYGMVSSHAAPPASPQPTPATGTSSPADNEEEWETTERDMSLEFRSRGIVFQPPPSLPSPPPPPPPPPPQASS